MTAEPNPQRLARFTTARAVYALERIAARLDTMSRAASDQATAGALEEAACELAHHADALAQASAWDADTAANLARITGNPSTRA